MAKVKICGLMEPLHVQSAKTADALGFMFAPSKRRVEVEQAVKLARLVPEGTEKIGVFVNEEIAEIERIAEQVPLTMIQLHGDESDEFVQLIKLPVIKAFSIRTEEDVERMEQSSADYVLVDAPGVEFRGGSGKVFDWSLLKDSAISRDRLILAGGLGLHNVQSAIQQVQPYMVDVSSGVETEGVKDSAKIKEFIRQVRRAK